MAKYISELEIASVRLLTLELSEDEVAALIACMNHVLSHAGERVIEQVIGAYRDELEAIRDDLSDYLENAKPEAEAQPPVAEPA
jgi:predicted RNA-binding protein